MNDTATTVVLKPASPATVFYDLWLAGHDSDATRRTYEASLRVFAAFTKMPTPLSAVEELLSLGRGPATAVVEAWRTDLRFRMAPNTVNARLTAIRHLMAEAKRFGLIDYDLDVANVQSRAYRETRGPGREVYRRLLADASKTPNPKVAARNVAILRLLHDTALRSKEVRGLTMEDVHREGERVWILGKARTQKEPITLPPVTLAALVAWLELRGPAPGFIFCRLDRGASENSYAKPISHNALLKLVNKHGKAAGAKVSPHGLRHTGITRAAELCNGNLVEVAAFSRHANLNTVKIYVDNARDSAGRIARMVAGD